MEKETIIKLKRKCTYYLSTKGCYMKGKNYLVRFPRRYSDLKYQLEAKLINNSILFEKGEIYYDKECTKQIVSFFVDDGKYYLCLMDDNEKTYSIQV